MRFLKPTTDVAFKRLFGTQKNAALTISFLNSVLGREEGHRITDVLINDSSNHPQTLDKKTSFVDVSCTDQAGKKYIVEMQVIDEKDFIQRAQYYAAVHLARQLKPTDRYKELMPVIFVGVGCYNLFDSEKYVSHYYIKEAKTNDRSLDLLEFHFVELSKFNKSIDDLDSELEKWAYLMKSADDMDKVPQQLQGSGAMSQALQVLQEGALSEEEFNAYMVQIDAWRGQRGFEERVREEAREQAQVMVKKAARDAFHDALVKTARAMLANKIDIATIIAVTGLSADEIERLSC